MTTACICSAGQLALPSDPPGLETVTVTGRWFAALPVRTLNSQWNTGGVETEKGEIMVVTGVVVATTVLLGVAVWLHMVGRRTRFVLVLSAATLLALAGCTSEGDNTASVVSSDPSASEPLSTADAADSAVESPTDPAMSSPNGSSPASESDGSATYPPTRHNCARPGTTCGPHSTNSPTPVSSPRAPPPSEQRSIRRRTIWTLLSRPAGRNCSRNWTPCSPRWTNSAPLSAAWETAALPKACKPSARPRQAWDPRPPTCCQS